jgi:hypothetical protein
MLPCRAGWKGRPVVVLGRKEALPPGVQPLISAVARPVKHVRLVTALLKAMALMRCPAQVRAKSGSPCSATLPGPRCRNLVHLQPFEPIHCSPLQQIALHTSQMRDGRLNLL